MKHRFKISAELVIAVMCASCARDPRAPTSATGASIEHIEITRAGSQPPAKGPSANFVGEVRLEPLFVANTQRRSSGAYVSFEAGARSAWHSHPAGQTLIVTAGTGWVQEWGEQKREMSSGDIVWTPPGVKHWHGATATSRMTHLALQEYVDGAVIEWMEQVSDEQYF